MRPLLLSWIFLLPVICFAQNLKYTRKKSHETLIYRIPADSTARYLARDHIPLDAYYNRTPEYIVLTDTFDASSDLPKGHYLLVSVDGYKLTARITVKSDLLVYVVNNDRNIQLAARDRWGNNIGHPKAWINDRPVDYVESSQTFRLRHRVKEDDIIKVCSATDTVFLNLEVDREAYRSVFKQRWQLFRETDIGRLVTFIPRKIIALINGRSYSRKRYNNGKGFIVFNQPKYKPGDTVKLKAYILSRKNRIYNNKAEVWLEYYHREKYISQSLGTISPASPGAYLKEFVLHDSLPNDITYTITFRNGKGKQLVQNRFSTEDYVLDEVASYSVRSVKEKYLSSDSIIIIANAKDANGLNLLDARAKLLLLSEEVDDWEKDSVIVADTLYREEKKLENSGDTRFAVSPSVFPQARMNIKAIVVFRNSNNEMQEESTSFDYIPRNNELVVSQQADTIVAEYFVDGKSVIAKGTVEIEGSKLELSKEIKYPLKLKIDPLAEEYWFDVDNDTTIYENIELEEGRGLVTSTRVNNKDTLGFILHNPYRLPVFYSVMNGDHIVAMGKGETAAIEWNTIEKNHRQAYKVKWQYRWRGEEEEGYDMFGFPYKTLDVGVQSQPMVFPGQKDTVTVTVTDFRGRPASNVNLTAASYNSQFRDDISMPSLPYTAKYKLRYTFDRDSYDNEDASFSKRFILGQYPEWRKKFGIDTMVYYQALFPDSFYHDVMTVAPGHYPQVSVHLVRKGVPQEIFMLYLNRRFVFYNGVTDKKNYAFFTPGGYLQIGVRLLDQFIEIDSIYIQPNYKHELFFDLDKLPASARVSQVGKELTGSEQQQLRSSLWQLYTSEYSNYDYVWQYGEAIKIGNNYNHLVGPFYPKDSLHYYKPGRFDLHFPFEPGYEYRLYPKMVRLENKPLFYKSGLKLKPAYDFNWTLGDTVLLPPKISYEEPVKTPVISFTTDFRYQYKASDPGKGRLFIRPQKDTLLRYVMLYPANDTITPVVMYGTTRTIYGLEPGNYTLVMVRQDLQAMEMPVTIKAHHGTYIKTGPWIFRSTNIVNAVREWQEKQREAFSARYAVKPATSVYQLPPGFNNGVNIVMGRITDAAGGKPVPSAAIQLKGAASFGVASDNQGGFVMQHLVKGQYILVISSIGYTTQEVAVNVEDSVTVVNVALHIAKYESLDEVVVTAYGVQRRSADRVSYMMMPKSNLVMASRDWSLGAKFEEAQYGFYSRADSISYGITLRGAASLQRSDPGLYVIDGILYDQLPANINPNDFTSIEILKDAEATSIYGSRAAGGVIVISTKSKTLRNQFRDYAFWQPQFFTDKNGVAKFEVTYPDNVTSWQTIVTGIDKKNRSGVGMSITKAYKPVMAQLSIPQFAIEGDRFNLVAKTLNYTKDKYQVVAGLRLFGDPVAQWNFELPAAESVIQLHTVAAAKDTLNFQFNISTSTGFKDGEEKKLPVLPMGTLESTGRFYIMQKDSTIHYEAQKDGSTEMYIQNNTLDLLLNELEHLERYPYYCMEQVASKLKGYLMEKKIREALRQDFRHQKALQRLLEKLQKAQHYDGGWSWWEQGNADLYITNYILQALLPMKADPVVAINLRNGYLFLQNRLPDMKNNALLYSLVTLVEGGHLLDYQPYISKFHFDSLSLHQQWMLVRVKQLLSLDHQNEMETLIAKKITTMTGGVYWGEETYTWYDNHVATTVLAFSVLEKNETYRHLLPMVVQYFLESRTDAYWRNTVESASITATIVPQVIKNNEQFSEPAVMEIKGDTSFQISHFPFAHSFGSGVRRFDVNKKGGGLTYVTLYQNWWNKMPAPVNDRFVVNTYFESNNTTVATLAAGERVKMKIDVTALQQAEYVMIEIPVPAGCILVNKRTDGNTQYFKDKVVIFRELLTKGDHHLTIELECRYAGLYTLNPAKASLMYFPTFFGRNGMRSVEIK